MRRPEDPAAVFSYAAGRSSDVGPSHADLPVPPASRRAGPAPHAKSIIKRWTAGRTWRC